MHQPSEAELRSSMEAILLQVGYCLHQFSKIEQGVSGFFNIASEIPHQTAGNIIMASVVSFSARLQICTNLLNNNGKMSEFTTEHKLFWKTLSKKLLFAAALRNELAHFQVMTHLSNTEPARTELIPFFSMGRISIKGAWNGISLSVINSRLEYFIELEQSLIWLCEDVKTHRGELERNEVRAPEFILALREKAAKSNDSSNP